MTQASPHDWREAVPLGAGYVCADCNSRCAASWEMRWTDCRPAKQANWAEPMAKIHRGGCRGLQPYVGQRVTTVSTGRSGIVYQCPCWLEAW